MTHQPPVPEATAEVRYTGDRELVVDGTTFSFGFLHGDPGDRILLMKEPTLVERTIRLVRDLAPQRILEVGIFHGGSTALLASLARPELLIAIDIAEAPVTKLHDHLERTGLDASVRIHYGIDQADAATLRAILDADLGDALLDLIIDDASHRYAETRRTFELTFARLRPGGTYIIEDWDGEHAVSDLLRARLGHDGARRPEDAELWAAVDARLAASPDGPPPTLARLAAELVIARACPRDLIRSVTVEADWITIVRGDDPLEDGFALDDLLHDHDGLLDRRC